MTPQWHRLEHMLHRNYYLHCQQLLTKPCATFRRSILDFTNSLNLFRIVRPLSTMPNHAVNTTARLKALRELMARDPYKVDAYVVPTEDQRSSSILIFHFI